jgi:hypothetical protein
MSAPKNITELRNDLLESFEQVKKDPRRLAQAGELANTAGKIIASVKVQLEYSIILGQEPEIDFLGETSGKPLSKIKLLK